MITLADYTERPPNIQIPILLGAEHEGIFPVEGEAGLATVRASTQEVKAITEALERHQEPILGLVDDAAAKSHVHVLDMPEGVKRWSVGRTDDNDIIIVHDTISSVHAVIGRSKGRWFVQDLGSSNGTFVNRARLKPEVKTAIGVGTCLRFGNRIFYYMQGARLGIFCRAWKGEGGKSLVY